MLALAGLAVLMGTRDPREGGGAAVAFDLQLACGGPPRTEPARGGEEPFGGGPPRIEPARGGEEPFGGGGGPW
jgi:hypothetical protein